MNWIARYVSNFLKVQLALTLTSLPILVSWGLPISFMTVVGNFIFVPVLTVFLIISSLLFFTELVHMPNGILVVLLSHTTTVWEWMLSFGRKEWLIPIAQPNTVTGYALLAVLILFLLRFLLRVTVRFFTFVVIVSLLVAGVGQYVHQRAQEKSYIRVVPGSREKLAILRNMDHSLTISDDGFFNRKQSPDKYVSFELKPYIIKKYGTMAIDTITLKKPKQGSFKAALELCDTFTVKKVKMAYFNHELSKSGWRSFFELKRFLVRNDIALERFRV